MAKTDKTEQEWEAQLSPQEFEVARRKGTEPAFTGRYCDNKEAGSYLCVCCSAKLFSSDDKYDSGSGWPSFCRAAQGAPVSTEADNSMGVMRTEVVCSDCGAHLGHVFADGPQPTGERFCINSVSLKFKAAGGSDV